LSEAPSEVDAQITELRAPHGLPDLLLDALDGALRRMAGLAKLAYLAGAVFDEGRRGHVLAFVDSADGAEPALARAVQNALALSGLDAGALDVTFIAANDARAADFARVGLRVDLPQPEVAAPVEIPAPGMDPAKPPRLR
jgi:hypothetical protein